jgi:hypothetical protein
MKKTPLIFLSLLLICSLSHGIANGEDWKQFGNDNGEGRVAFYDKESIKTSQGPIKQFWFKLTYKKPRELYINKKIMYLTETRYLVELACKSKQHRRLSMVVNYTDSSHESNDSISPWKYITSDSNFNDLYKKICK